MGYRSIIKKIRKVLTFLLCMVILASAFPAGTAAYASNIGESAFQIDFIDVGQGDSALVQCDGHYMLVDGGDSKKSSLIYTYLKNRSISYIDVMVATHPDADHIGGLSGALNYANVGVAYSPVTSHDTKVFGNFVKYLAKQGKSITVPNAGDSFMLGSAKITVLGPGALSSLPNNNSIILRIEYGSTSFLLAGDAEMEEENLILNSGQTLQSTVLKVAHHGSDNSTGYRFLREVSPQYAVISVGKGNQYGHPTENVLSRLRDADVLTYRTDLQGDIICRSDGKKVTFTTGKNSSINTLADAGEGHKSNTVVYPSNNENIPGNDAIAVNDTRSTENMGDTGIEASYVLNKNTKKFHVQTCNSVSQMKEKNKIYFTGSRQEVIDNGYVPCKNCNP